MFVYFLEDSKSNELIELLHSHFETNTVNTLEKGNIPIRALIFSCGWLGEGGLVFIQPSFIYLHLSQMIQDVKKLLITGVVSPTFNAIKIEPEKFSFFVI